VDRAVGGSELLDAAERHSALVAASFGDETAGVTSGAVLGRAGRSKVALRLQDDDGTALVVYRGQRPGSRVERAAHRELREAIARVAAERLGRRRPWVPRIRLRVDS
jgi:hypothetical protein